MVFHGPHGFSWYTKEAKPNFRWKKISLKVLVTSLGCQCAARPLAPAVWCILPPGWLWAFWPRQPKKKTWKQVWRLKRKEPKQHKTTVISHVIWPQFYKWPNGSYHHWAGFKSSLGFGNVVSISVSISRRHQALIGRLIVGIDSSACYGFLRVPGWWFP